MKIVDLVKKLDRMVAKGHIMEAFEEFFSEDVITHSSAGDKSEGKVQKRGFLQGFFSNMDATDEIKLHDNLVADDKTFSSFTFKFRNKQNEMLVWNEIIRRTWKDGQVVDEYYFTGDLDELKKEVSAQKKADKVEKGKAKKTPASPDTKSPASIASPIKKAASSKKKTTTKAAAKVVDKQNLRLVEGIGPKIEQLLNADGIKTFGDLAKAKQPKLKSILSAAGPRFSMHSPETWPQQAKLLASGKKEELQKLQDELKGGRKI